MSQQVKFRLRIMLWSYKDVRCRYAHFAIIAGWSITFVYSRSTCLDLKVQQNEAWRAADSGSMRDWPSLLSDCRWARIRRGLQSSVLAAVLTTVWAVTKAVTEEVHWTLYGTATSHESIETDQISNQPHRNIELIDRWRILRATINQIGRPRTDKMSSLNYKCMPNY